MSVRPLTRVFIYNETNPAAESLAKKLVTAYMLSLPAARIGCTTEELKAWKDSELIEIPHTVNCEVGL